MQLRDGHFMREGSEVILLQLSGFLEGSLKLIDCSCKRALLLLMPVAGVTSPEGLLRHLPEGLS